MNTKRLRPLLILAALPLVACGTDMQSLLSEDDTRAQAIETLTTDPSMREEVIDRLLSTPEERAALLEKVANDDEVAAVLVKQMMQSDRTMAVAANQIGSDNEATRTLIGMLMLTGAIGEIVSQDQAECLELGEAFAHGNQIRTMGDLKRLGEIIDGWARQNDGLYPVCGGYEDVTACLTASLPDGALADLRLNDAWGRPIRYHSDDDGRSYVLISYATDGEFDQLGMAGPTASHDADITFSNGDFLQWPGHIPKEKIR